MLNHNYFISKHLVHIHYMPGLYCVDFLRTDATMYMKMPCQLRLAEQCLELLGSETKKVAFLRKLTNST